MKLLVVDDEVRHRRGMVNLIRTIRPDYEVVAAKNGEEALASVEHDRPHIVLTDIRMPAMDGLTFLRSLEGRAHPPKVIFLSAYNLFEYAQTALRHGASDYLLKPVDPDKVEAALRRVEEQLKEKEAPLSAPAAPASVAKPRIGAEAASGEQKRGRSELVVEACVRLIQEKYREELTLESVAESFYFNASYFSTLIRSHTGSTFSELLLATRMNRAIELLSDRTCNLKIYEIAERCGYRDAKYFCRLFRKHMGVSPDSYRHRAWSNATAGGRQ